MIKIKNLHNTYITYMLLKYIKQKEYNFQKIKATLRSMY